MLVHRLQRWPNNVPQLVMNVVMNVVINVLIKHYVVSDTNNSFLSELNIAYHRVRYNR